MPLSHVPPVPGGELSNRASLLAFKPSPNLIATLVSADRQARSWRVLLEGKFFGFPLLSSLQHTPSIYSNLNTHNSSPTLISFESRLFFRRICSTSVLRPFFFTRPVKDTTNTLRATKQSVFFPPSRRFDRVSSHRSLLSSFNTLF